MCIYSCRERLQEVSGSGRMIDSCVLVTSVVFIASSWYSARHNYTRGVTKYDNFFLAPPGSTKTEIEQFWHMEIVGVIITKIWFSDRKSRSVNNSFQRPDLGLRWNFTPRVNPPDRTNPPPGADFSILPSGFNYDTQSIGVYSGAGSKILDLGSQDLGSESRTLKYISVFASATLSAEK